MLNLKIPPIDDCSMLMSLSLNKNGKHHKKSLYKELLKWE